VLGVVWWVAGILAIATGLRDVLTIPADSTSPGTAQNGVPLPPRPSGLLYLLCLWGVIWSACLAASLMGESEANWMAPGSVALVVLTAARADLVLSRRGPAARAYVAAWACSLAAVVAIHHTEWFYPAVARWIPSPTNRWAAPLRLVDLTARLRGHKDLARAV